MLILTGARRGVGRAAATCFSAAGRWVIACSRRVPLENCLWEAGPEDQVLADLTDHADIKRGVETMHERRHDAPLSKLVNNVAISPKGANGARPGLVSTTLQDRYEFCPFNFDAPLMQETGGSDWR